MRANRVLTRPRGWALLVAVVVAAAVPLAGGTLSGAQLVEPTLTVKKVVTGVVPPGTTFTVSVECVTDSNAPVVITFDAQGDPTSGNSTFTVPRIPVTCTATETVTGGAQSVSYTCVVGSGSTDTTCPTRQSVTFGADSSGASATITVTNAFPPPPPPPPPPPVVVSPRFTG